MDTMHKKYIDKYGNFSHILNIKMDNSLNEDETNKILNDIFVLINEKDIQKYTSNMDINIKWRVYDNTDLLHYYTDGNGILGDRAIYEHTNLLLKDIQKIKNSDKFKIILSKPLTKSICIM